MGLGLDSGIGNINAGWGGLGLDSSLTVGIGLPAAEFALVSAPEAGGLLLVGLGVALTLARVKRRPSGRVS